jgi:hypothetical protein
MINNEEKRMEINAAWSAYTSPVGEDEECTQVSAERKAYWLEKNISAQNMLCFYCTTRMTKIKEKNDGSLLATLSYIVTPSMGGLDEFNNTAAACAFCDFKKGDLPVDEFWTSDALRSRVDEARVAPDQLSNDPKNPHHDAASFERGVAVQFEGGERTDVHWYSMSEGWIKVGAGTSVDRQGKPLLFKLKGHVVASYRDTDLILKENLAGLPKDAISSISNVRRWKTTFSDHGIERLNQRTSLSVKQLADILDGDRAVNMGTEQGTHRVSRLFFASDDNDFFVAIQDMSNGVVVTVLTIFYWGNLGTKQGRPFKPIKSGHFKDAQKLIDPNRQIADEIVKPSEAQARIIQLQGKYLSDIGHIKSTRIGRISFSDYETRSHSLVVDDVLQNIVTILDSKNVNIEQLVYIQWRVGKKSEWQNIDVKTLDEFRDALVSIMKSNYSG